MTSKYKEQIISIIRKYLKHDQVEVIIFGSRAEGNALTGSDIDIALKGNDLINESIFRKIKDDFEDSNIPYKIDLVDYNSASDTLKESIDRKGILW